MGETSSTLDLAFVYVDLGDDFYKYATHKMVQSARQAMPGVRIIQLTDNETKAYPDADLVMRSDTRAEKDTVCVFKGKAIAEYALQAENPVIFSDVDILWRKKPEMPWQGVGLMRRDGFPCMPYNTGVMLSASDDRSQNWWENYLIVVDDLAKNGMGGWYADQIAASICGWHVSCRYNMDDVCPTPENDNGSSPAVHFKGPRKHLMLEAA